MGRIIITPLPAFPFGTRMVVSDITSFFSLILNKLLASPLFIVLVELLACLFLVYIFKRLFYV